MNENGKNIVFYDVDGTITYKNIAFAFADELAARDGFDRGAYGRLKEAETEYRKHAATQDRTVEIYATLLSEGLKGRHATEIGRISRDFLEKTEMREVLATEIRELGNRGCSTALVSGTPMFLLEQLSDRLPATYLIGADIPQQNGTFTGERPGRFMTSDVKERVVLDFIGRGFFALAGYGDSMGDIGILKHVRYPTVISPRDELAEEAKARDWPIWRDGEKFTSVIKLMEQSVSQQL